MYEDSQSYFEISVYDEREDGDGGLGIGRSVIQCLVPMLSCFMVSFSYVSQTCSH